MLVMDCIAWKMFPENTAPVAAKIAAPKAAVG
jgi:hypothetical protein